MIKTVQSPARLLLKAFRNLKLAIIFKIFLLFYLLLNLIILSKFFLKKFIYNYFIKPCITRVYIIYYIKSNTTNKLFYNIFRNC